MCTAPLIDSYGLSLHDLRVWQNYIFIIFNHLFYMSTHPNSHASPSMVNRIENLRRTVNIGRLKLNGIWTSAYCKINETQFYRREKLSTQGANFFAFFFYCNQGSANFVLSFDIHLNVVHVQFFNEKQEMLWYTCIRTFTDWLMVLHCMFNIMFRWESGLHNSLF